MTHRRLVPLALVLTALACARSQHSRSAQSSSEPSSDSTAPSQAQGAAAENEAPAEEAAPSAQPPAPGRSQDATRDKKGARSDRFEEVGEEEKEASAEADASDRQSPALAGSKGEQSLPISWEQLDAERSGLLQDLAPQALSCDGALPHRDAICHIAERICALEESDPGRSREKHCEPARQACKEARESYQKRCR